MNKRFVLHAVMLAVAVACVSPRAMGGIQGINQAQRDAGRMRDDLDRQERMTRFLQETRIKALALKRVTLREGIGALQHECTALTGKSFDVTIGGSALALPQRQENFKFQNVSVMDALRTLAARYGARVEVTPYTVLFSGEKK